MTKDKTGHIITGEHPEEDRVLAVVTGATASGKTSLALELAEHYGCDIINADSRQIYRDIPIGTAAPTAEERARVRHHFAGCLGLEEYYSAARFEEDVTSLLPELWRKSRVAVMCGGSMMYVDAVTRGIDPMPTISETTRAYVLALLEQHGSEGIRAQLEILDPEYYAEADKDNLRRLVHAVEVSLEAGVPYSTLRTGKALKRDFKILKFVIDRPREELFARINARVEAMISAGLEDEARRALAHGPLNSLNTVGYKEMAMYLRGEMDFPTAVARIAKNTRVYAKKQLTWLKRDPEVIYLRPAEEAFSLARGHIDAALRGEERGD